MKVEIEIVDKLYDDIVQMCQFNNITVEKYIVDSVMDNFYTLKYGDLNAKFQPNTEKNEIKVEKKKVGRPRKEKNEEEIAKSNEVLKVEENFNQKANDGKDVDEKLINKIKRTRILKSK